MRSFSAGGLSALRGTDRLTTVTSSPESAIMRQVAGLLLTLAFAFPARSADWTPEAILKVKGVGHVQVSPDGTQVAFTVREAITEGEKSESLTHIHVAKADGSDPFPLT